MYVVCFSCMWCVLVVHVCGVFLLRGMFISCMWCLVFRYTLYGMGHKKVSISCFLKSRFLAVQRKRNGCNTARSVPR